MLQQYVHDELLSGIGTDVGRPAYFDFQIVTQILYAIYQAEIGFDL